MLELPCWFLLLECCSFMRQLRLGLLHAEHWGDCLLKLPGRNLLALVWKRKRTQLLELRYRNLFFPEWDRL